MLRAETIDLTFYFLQKYKLVQKALKTKAFSFSKKKLLLLFAKTPENDKFFRCPIKFTIMAKKGSNTTTSYIEWGEVQLLISRLERDKNYKFCLLIGCGVYTGLRISDLLQLKYSDILESETFFVNEKKTGKRREIKVNQHLRELVQRICEIQNVQDKNSLMFLNKYGTKPIDRCYVNTQLKVIIKRYHIKTSGNISSHLFRKCLGRRVMQVNNYSNESLILLSEVFGHSNPAITMRYLGLRQQEVLSVYDSLSV